jgi:F0F1-type ATP synthase assembly protein I
MPAQMLAIIGLGVFAGLQLDKICNFKYPIFTILFALISVILAIYYFIKDLIK